MAILDLSTYKSLTNTTVTTYDSYITDLLPVVQNEIEIYCDRLFDAQVHKQWCRFDHSRLITLPQYPVNSIYFIGSPTNVANISITSGTYNIEVNTDKVTIVDLNSYNYPTDDYLFSDNNTLADLKAAIEGDYPLISISIVSGYETMNSQLLRTGIGDSWTGATKVDSPARLLDNHERTIRFAEDAYFSYNLDFYFPENLYIIWNGGYTSSTMPSSLQMIEAGIIKDYIGYSLKKPGFGLYQSESITNYSYTLWDINYLKNIIISYDDRLLDFKKKSI